MTHFHNSHARCIGRLAIRSDLFRAELMSNRMIAIPQGGIAD
jgi:hypothetical protein